MSLNKEAAESIRSVILPLFAWNLKYPSRLVAIFVTFTLAVLSITKYRSLHSTVYDMGTFQSNLFQISNLNIWQGAFHGHAQPVLYIWAFFYKILPLDWSPIFLLSMQALLLTLPAWFLAPRYGFLGVVAFSLYFPIWFNGLFDFHVDHIAVPLLFAFFFLIEDKRYLLATFPALLLTLIKEPFALQTAACGIFLVIHCRKYIPGLFLMIWGFVYFILATKYLLPYFSMDNIGPGIGSPQFAWLGDSLSEIIITLTTRPFMVLQHIYEDKGKIDYLLIIFGSLGFLSFLRPVYLIPALPLLAISLLADGSYDNIEHHYTAGLIAPAIFSFLKGKETVTPLIEATRIPKRWFYTALITVLLGAHIIYSPSPLSTRFWGTPGFPYHHSAYFSSDRDQWIKEAIKEHIPNNPKVIVATQNSLNWGHLAHRKLYVGFPKSVFEPSHHPEWSEGSLNSFWRFIKTGGKTYSKAKGFKAEFIVLDLKRPWYIVDRGCLLIDGKCKNLEFSKNFLGLVDRVRQSFKMLFEKDGFMIFKRIPGNDINGHLEKRTSETQQVTFFDAHT